MAQQFRRYTANNVGTSAVTVTTANSNDALVGIHITNKSSSQALVDVYINDGSNDIYLADEVPIPSGSALQLLDGGAKVVIQSGDALKVKSSIASSLDVWVSAVDAIST